MQQGGLPSSDRVRAVFDEVLADSDFRYAEAAPWARWLQALVDFLRDILTRWWPELGDSEIRLISWAALALLAVTSILLIHRWASRSDRRRRRAAGSADMSPGAPLDARGWAARSLAAAAAGRYREAATGLYQSTILELDAAGRLAYRDWKTPGDYALEIAGEDAARARFLSFLADFVGVAFGPVEPDASSFASLTTRAAALGGGV